MKVRSGNFFQWPVALQLWFFRIWALGHLPDWALGLRALGRVAM